jgi:hypothetical protein
MIGRDAISPEQGVHKKLMSMYKQAVDARKPYDADAWLNIAFFNGNQYSEWSEDNIREIPRKRYNEATGQPDEADVPRPVFNKIQHFVLTAHAETLQDKPSADVLPASDDYAAMIDQDVNKAYLDFIMEPVNANWDLQLSVATMWALVTPSGFLKWVWDPTLKRPDVRPVPFFDLAIDPYVVSQAGGFARARYIFHTMFLSVDQVEESFGVHIDKNDVGHVDSFRVDLLRSMGSAPLSEGVNVHELWMKPNAKHPRGMYAVFTDNKLLLMKDALPYEHLWKSAGGMLPFTQLGSLLRPDSMYYLSPVSALRLPQMVWNRFVAQAVMIQNSFAAPKWSVPEEIQLQTPINTAPNQILRYSAGNTGLKPELIQPAQMPDMSRMLALFEQQMMHVVSVHEVSQGQVPGRVEAAKAIELLQTSDKGRYKHLLDTIDQSISIGWWHELMLARQFETEEKMVTVYTREGVPLVRRWRKGAADPGTRIRVVRMGGLGRTRAERQDSLLLLWQNHIITDPDQMAELMEVPIPSFTNARANDVRMARTENEEMANETKVAPGSWENHAIHIREHNEYRKTYEFHVLTPKAKSIFEFHVQQHKKMQLQQAFELSQLIRAQQGIDPNAPVAVNPQGPPGSAAPPQPGEQQGMAAPPEQQPQAA